MLNKLTGAAFAALLILATAGCKEEQPKASHHHSPPEHKPPVEHVPVAVVVEAEKRVEAERAMRVHTESELIKKDGEKSRWQTLALLMTSGAIVLLIAGAILGSKARDEAA